MNPGTEAEVSFPPSAASGEELTCPGLGVDALPRCWLPGPRFLVCNRWAVAHIPSRALASMARDWDPSCSREHEVHGHRWLQAHQWGPRHPTVGRRGSHRTGRAGCHLCPRPCSQSLRLSQARLDWLAVPMAVETLTPYDGVRRGAFRC